MTLDEKIAQAQRHVESGRRIIERQQVIVVSDPQPTFSNASTERSRFSRWTWPICSSGVRPAQVGGKGQREWLFTDCCKTLRWDLTRSGA
jgi:hypothetical protein